MTRSPVASKCRRPHGIPLPAVWVVAASADCLLSAFRAGYEFSTLIERVWSTQHIKTVTAPTAPEIIASQPHQRLYGHLHAANIIILLNRRQPLFSPPDTIAGVGDCRRGHCPSGHSRASSFPVNTFHAILIRLRIENNPSGLAGTHRPLIHAEVFSLFSSSKDHI